MSKKTLKVSQLFTVAVFATVLFVGCGSKNGIEIPQETPAIPETATPTVMATAEPTPTAEPEEAPAPEVLGERVCNEEEYYRLFVCSDKEKSVSVNVDGMKNFGVDAYYLLTVRFEDGTCEQREVKAENGVINEDFDRTVEQGEVSVVMKFSLGKDKSSPEEGYVNIPWTEQYDRTKDAGFEGNVDTHPKGVNLRSEMFSFVVAMPNGRYDITVKKAEQARSTLRINEGAFGVNVGIGGTDRKGDDRIFAAKDVVVEGGEARFSSIGDGNMCYIEFRRVSEFFPRKTHIYIAGDSTVQTYYPRFDDREYPAGTAQTGWGQLFHHYTTDEVVVDALGAGGTYAKSWYEMYFRGIINNAMPGDFFIIQEGINDRTYSSTEEMKEYLTLMVDWCLENKVIPVLVTSQQTAKFWKDRNGTDLPEYGTPEGSGLYPFAETIRELAKEKDVFLVDNAALTSEWYTKVGRSYVEQTYHLFNAAKGTSVDSLHSSYMGSRKIAELIATKISEMIENNVKDAYGESLSGIALNPVADYDFSYVNSEGQEVTETLHTVEYR